MMGKTSLLDWIQCALIVYVAIMVLVIAPEASGIKLPPVHWNSSNPM